MRRRDKSFTPSLCVSMILHGLGLSAMAWWYVATSPAPKWPPLDKVSILLAQIHKMDVPAPPPPAAVPPASKPHQQKKTPKQDPFKYEKPEAIHDDSGEHIGVGTANRSTDGKEPMKANAGLEQADLMRDAVKFVADAFLPSRKGGLKSNNVEKQTSPAQGTPDPEMTQKQVAVAAPVSPVMPAPVPEKLPGPMPVKTAEKTNPATPGAKDPVANVPAGQVPKPKPVEREIVGHRATASDTESIAFAKAEHSVFQAGKLEGRKGLKTVTTMPDFGDSAYAELRMMDRLHLVLGVTVYDDGSIRNVEVLESSGSASVDQDFKNAVWNHWNLEPRKDQNGHPTDLHWVVVCE